MGFEGRVAIVTGGGQGIGEGISLHLAKLGCNIAIVDLNMETAGAVVKKIEAMGRKSIAVKCDVANFDDTKKMAAHVVKQLGKIDILVNDAGYVKPEQSSFHAGRSTLLAEGHRCLLQWRDLLSRSCLEYMTQAKYGKIVSIASDAGRVGQRGQAVYSGAKGAVIAFSKALAQEVARYGVNVNCVSPGATDTGVMTMPKEMHDKITSTYLFKRMAVPADHANAVAFLCSDDSNYITGQTISVSSGYTMI